MSGASWQERDASDVTSSEHCLSATRALCHSCGELVEAKIVLQGDAVYLSKWCPEHGTSRALICSDRDWYLRAQSYIKPGTSPLARAVERFEGCPESCGLCPRHQQHSCVPILEITGACDMSCPICLVDGHTGATMKLAEVEGILDALVRYEGQLNMLNISGGEPTVHPDFMRIVDACLRPEIGVVSVSTNGLWLAEDEDRIKALRDRGVVISLQCDGFTAETGRRLRGREDLGEIKRRLIERAVALGARVSLTVTLARGVNEHELPGILELFFAHDEILSVMVQPVAHSADTLAHLGADPLDIITIPDVVRLLAAGSGGVLREQDFTPLPCSHPSCFALTYLLRTTDGKLVSLPSMLDTETYLDVIKNQALFGADSDSLYRLKDAVTSLWSSDGQVPDRDSILRTVKQLMLDLNRLGAGASHREVLELGVKNVKSIFIHHFMDRYTFDQSRLVKCCNHYPQIDGRLLPACGRNNLTAAAATQRPPRGEPGSQGQA